MVEKIDRLSRERQFHDQWASTIDLHEISINAAFEGSTAPENRFILTQLGDIKGKYLLDLGCGAGESSVYFARKGVRCVAGDYSTEMIQMSKKLAKLYDVEIEAHIVNAEELNFADNTFDIVYASNILHHVDAEKSLAEIYRVLKVGGTACIWEPMRHNPIINIYRWIASDVRTEDEHPLSIFFVDLVKRIFAEVTYETFWYATLWILLRFFLVERVNPNKERYWKKIINEEKRLRSIYYRLEKYDRLFKKIPLIKRLGWTLAIVAKK